MTSKSPPSKCSTPARPQLMQPCLPPGYSCKTCASHASSGMSAASSNMQLVSPHMGDHKAPAKHDTPVGPHLGWPRLLWAAPAKPVCFAPAETCLPPPSRCSQYPPTAVLTILLPSTAYLSDHIWGGLAVSRLLPRKLCCLRYLRQLSRQLPLDARHIQLSSLGALCLAQAALRAQVQLQAIHCRWRGCRQAEGRLHHPTVSLAGAGAAPGCPRQIGRLQPGRQKVALLDGGS